MKKRMVQNLLILSVAYIGGLMNAFAGSRSVKMGAIQTGLFIFGRVILYAFVGLIYVMLRDMRDHRR